MRFLFVLLLSAAALVAQPSATQGAPPQPHLVFIVADDLGWGDVGWHGSDVRTPNLDQLAAQGVRLDAHYGSPWCSPSRAALLTGKHSHRLGVHHDDVELPAGTRILPEVLRSAGYETALVGKWHVGQRPGNRPLDQGFDHQYGTWGGRVGYYTHRTPAGRLDWRRQDQLVEESGYATTLLGDEAVRRITERDTARPLFLYLSFTAPHAPIEPPAGTGGDSDRERFAAMVEALDEQVGRVYSALQGAGMADNTLVVFQSDNGGNARFGASNLPFRGGKLTVWEGGVRVPAFVWGPHRFPAGRTVEMTHVTDWAPTLAAWAGATVPPGVDGVDLTRLLQTGAAARSGLLIFRSPTQVAYRHEDWKLTRQGGRWGLYNLAADPGEERNRASEFPALLAVLREKALERRSRPSDATATSEDAG